MFWLVNQQIHSIINYPSVKSSGKEKELLYCTLRPAVSQILGIHKQSFREEHERICTLWIYFIFFPSCQTQTLVSYFHKCHLIMCYFLMNQNLIISHVLLLSNVNSVSEEKKKSHKVRFHFHITQTKQFFAKYEITVYHLEFHIFSVFTESIFVQQVSKAKLL